VIPAWKIEFEKQAGTKDGFAWNPNDVTSAIEALSEILSEIKGSTVGDTERHLKAALTSISKISESLELYDLTEGLKKLL